MAVKYSHFNIVVDVLFEVVLIWWLYSFPAMKKKRDEGACSSVGNKKINKFPLGILKKSKERCVKVKKVRFTYPLFTIAPSSRKDIVVLLTTVGRQDACSFNGRKYVN